jgi:uncharacterized membrane protein
MRIVTIAGIALIVLGGVLLFTGGSFTTRRDVLDIGGLKVSAEEKRPIPPWVAGIVLIGGFALTIEGIRRKA